MSSARTNQERIQYHRQEEAEKQQAEAKQRQADEERSRPIRQAEQRLSETLTALTEDEAETISAESVSLAWLQTNEFVLGKQTLDAKYEQAAYQFKLATPTFNPKDETHKSALTGFLQRNSSIRLDVMSNLAKAWQLLLEYGLVTPFTPPAQEEAPVHEAPAGPTPSELADQRRQDYFSKVVVKHPVTGVELTEYALSLLPSKEELYLRRFIERGHTGSERLDEYWERRDVITAQQAALSAVVPAHPGEEN